MTAEQLLERTYSAFNARDIDAVLTAMHPAVSFALEPDGRVAVDVHQLVRDLAGKVLKDEVVRHVYLLESGLIRSMEIRRGATSTVTRG